MKKLTSIICILCFVFASVAQTNDTIYLIIQGDDIGSSHAANMGCIESYKNGIETVTELMVPCPWFLQAARLLKENPGLDVGLHLCLTSEWSEYKWRPLTCCPSITDSNGYFLPMIWPREDMPKGTALREAKWDYNEIEKELRAQIELALKHVPHISHLSGHMGWGSIDPKVEELRNILSKEYGLETNPQNLKIQGMGGWGKAATLDERVKNFNENLNKLTPGIYRFVDHPGMDTPEMRDINHPGYLTVAADRDMVTKVFCDPSVKKTIEKKKIKLIGYKDIATIKL